MCILQWFKSKKSLKESFGIWIDIKVEKEFKAPSYEFGGFGFRSWENSKLHWEIKGRCLVEEFYETKIKPLKENPLVLDIKNYNAPLGDTKFYKGFLIGAHLERDTVLLNCNLSLLVFPNAITEIKNEVKN